MALPKRKHSTARRGKRRAEIKLKLPALAACSNCGELFWPHHVCPACGYYKGKQVIFKKGKKARK